jgi:hypothetical protein
VLLNRRPFRNAIPSGPSKSGDRNSTLPLPDEFAEVGLSFFDRHSECHALHVSLCTRIRLATRDTNATHHTLRQRKIRGSWKCCRQSRLADWCRLAPPLAQGTVLRIVGYQDLGSSRQGNRPISAKLRGWRRGFAQSHRTLQRSLPAGRDQLSVSRTAARHTDSESSFIVDMDHCCRNQLFLRCWQWSLRGSAEVDLSCQNQRAEGDPPDPRIHLRRGTSVTPHVRHAPPLTAEQDIEYVVHIRRRGSFPVHRT